MKKYYTAKQVMEVLQISRSTLYRLVKSGSLKCYKISNLNRFDEQDILSFLEESRT